MLTFQPRCAKRSWNGSALAYRRSHIVITGNNHTVQRVVLSMTDVPTSTGSPGQTRIMTTKVDGHVDDIVRQFTTWLEEKGIVVYATVDHAKDMRDRGVEPPVTAWTVVFGNPKLGATMLAVNPGIVVDIPLRVGFYQEDETSTMIVRRLMTGLLADHGKEEQLVAPGNTADALVSGWVDSIAG